MTLDKKIKLKNADTPRRIRLDGPDTLRGAALCSMLIYHACWDLVWIFDMRWDWYASYGAYVWQQSICWSFILLSGWCCHLSRHIIKRGLIIFACGWFITLVTVLFMPGNRVVFGVLFLIGSAMILTGLSQFLFSHIPARAGVVCNFILFLLTRNFSSGILGAGVLSITLPRIFYRNDLTAAVGFPYPGFFSTDYFPLFPWIFLFWTGYFLYPLTPEIPLRCPKIPILSAILSMMGRHSLLIYILHQPVIYGVCRILFR